MIRPGTHALTRQPRVIAECDEPGCDVSMYMQQELGVHSAGETLRAVGWEIYWMVTTSPAREIPVRCPTHAQTAEQCRHATIIVVDRVGYCQRCGRRPNEAAREAVA